MKHVIFVAALALLPAAALAQNAAPAAAGASLPMCSAKVQDSCQQGPAQQARALDHYPADKRDAGNNKIGAPMAAMHKPKPHSVRKSIVTKDATMSATPQ